MKKIFMLFAVMLTLPCYAKATIQAQEVYVAVYPSSQYLEIIEYNLLLDSSNIENIKRNIKNLKQDVQEAKYATTRSPFKYFISSEEKIIKEKSYVKGHYHLLTKEHKKLKILQDVFEEILNRKVDVKIEHGAIQMVFNGDGLRLADNNASGIYGKGNQRMIAWKDVMKKFELVIGFNDIKGKIPIAKYFNQNISSPNKTKAEIQKMKYGLKNY